MGMIGIGISAPGPEVIGVKGISNVREWLMQADGL